MKAEEIKRLSEILKRYGEKRECAK